MKKELLKKKIGRMSSMNVYLSWFSFSLFGSSAIMLNECKKTMQDQDSMIIGITCVSISIIVLVWCMIRHDKVEALLKEWIKMPNDD